MARILVVEDEAIVRQLLRAALEYEGYVVAEAQNGAEGLQRYAAVRADLVIVDMRMPVMDGGQMILELRRRWPNANILAISGDPGLLERASTVDVRGTLQKPFSIADLLDAVQKLVEQFEP